jgi:hypothetical protein
MKLYITYKDDGATGVGGQDTATTSARNKLYILEGTYQQIKNKIEEMESSFPSIRRKNPRFGDWYFEGPDGEGNDDYNDVVYLNVKDNPHLIDNLEEWYQRYDRENDFYFTILLNAPNGAALPKHLYVDISKFFDYYITSPNSHYNCPVRNKTYYIESKTRVTNNFNALLEHLKKYREHYDLLFLYEAGAIINDEPISYKIRFAGLNFDEYDKK